MRKTIIAVIAAWCTLPQAWAQTACPGKMSPLVREAAGLAGTGKRPAPADGDRLITAFVSLDTTAADSILKANGCRIYARSEDIYIVTVPTGRIASLSAANGVRRIEASRPCRTDMDTTATIVGATPAHDGTALPQAYTGSGVVVGVMDIGFDLTHPTFYDKELTGLRIGAFWDQLDTDTAGCRLPVGRDYAGSEALSGKKRSADGLKQTHGTHTLGIAAGSGYDSPYRGMAYGSDICLVSNAVSSDLQMIDPDDIYKYTSATDALGFKYIFDYAASKGSPCVASFSEGYVPAYTGEDSLYSRYLERLTGPGRIIVASAGNESVYYNYADKPAGKPEAGSCLYSGEAEAGFFIEADGPFTLILAPVGDAPAHATTVDSWQCPADTITTVALTPAGNGVKLTAAIERYAAASAAKDTIYHVTVTRTGIGGAIGNLAVWVSGAETAASVRCYSPAMFINGAAGWAPADAEISHNIHAPACFPAVIAVGSTIHRTGFTNYLGQHFDYSQPGRNDGVRSEYSSMGPTMDGMTKPDVMAPGDNIVSAYSSYYEESNPYASDIRSDVAHFDFRGRTYAWNSNTGTSMAAPVVAGAIALWLEARPDLTPAEVRSVLSHTCRKPEAGLAYPNNQYGHGEIDVYRGLLRLLGIDGIEGISTNMPLRMRAAVSPEGMLTLRIDGAPAGDFGIKIYSVGGTPMLSRTVRACGVAEYRIDVSALGPGVYVVQASSPEPGMNGSMLIRR